MAADKSIEHHYLRIFQFRMDKTLPRHSIDLVAMTFTQALAMVLENYHRVMSLGVFGLRVLLFYNNITPSGVKD